MTLIEKTKIELVKSIESSQYEWRIMRVSSFIDLIIVKLGSYFHSKDSGYLQELPSLIVKCLYNFRYGEVDPETLIGSYSIVEDQPQMKERIIGILSDIQEYNLISKSTFYQKMTYLRQVREFDYSNVIEENLMDIFYECNNEN